LRTILAPTGWTEVIRLQRESRAKASARDPTLAKKIISSVMVIGLAAAIYCATRHNAASGVAGKVTREHPVAPDLTLPDLAGQKLQLSTYRGKVILLDFWATWCDPCRDEIPHFVALQSKYRDQGFQIFGVSMDDGPAPVREFYQRYRMNYPVVMGDANTGELYGGILGLPIAFLIGRDGRIYVKRIGATDISVLENEIVKLLQTGTDSRHPAF
jgi:peroxiredoxin